MIPRLAFTGFLALAVAGAQPQPSRGRGPGAPPGGGARFLGAEVGIPGRVVKNAPFSAEIVTESSQALPDGNRIKQSSTVRFYRDSDGRTRREQALQNLNGLAPNSSLPQVAFISDPVNATAYALDLGKRTANKTSWRPGAGRMMSDPDGAPRPMMRGRSGENLKTESLGRQMVEGVQADGTRTTLTIPAGAVGNELPIQVVSETWYSPELQTAILRKRSDPRSGESVTRYTNITRAEPSRVLFAPPADFKITESHRPQPRQ
jgi:hypothetical protein